MAFAARVQQLASTACKLNNNSNSHALLASRRVNRQVYSECAFVYSEVLRESLDVVASDNLFAIESEISEHYASATCANEHVAQHTSRWLQVCSYHTKQKLKAITESLRIRDRTRRNHCCVHLRVGFAAAAGSSLLRIGSGRT